MSIEKIYGGSEFDQTDFEVEKQYISTDLKQFDHFKDTADLEVIEQVYLSQPDEPYSLRLRATTSPNGTEYTATLKDRGVVTLEGLRRLEIETSIAPETYAYYTSSPLPTLRKLRARPATGVTIDWCEGRAEPIIEIEKGVSNQAAQFYEAHEDSLIDVSGSTIVSSETLAHTLSPDCLPPTPRTISAHEIVAQIMRERYQAASPVITCISGRSGSGKSTITREVLNLIPPHLRVLRLCTDDYHRGKTWLESTYGAPWTNWDAPEVYDMALLARDLAELQAGRTIEARRFDFGLEEPVVGNKIPPADLIIIEGIYAASPDLAAYRHVNIVTPTPLATCVGRRLERDKKENRLNASLGGLEGILRYQLETAEPTYRQQT